MRGLVFTEFLDFAERTAGFEMVEQMLERCDLASGGAYTSVGSYDHREILAMLAFLEGATRRSAAGLLTGFGRQLFDRLVAHHPGIRGDGVLMLDFLEGVETHIHRQVRKLYPGAELPLFSTERAGPNLLILRYDSVRPFADLAHGMLLGAVAHFGDRAELRRNDDPERLGFAAEFRVGLAI